MNGWMKAAAFLKRHVMESIVGVVVLALAVYVTVAMAAGTRPPSDENLVWAAAAHEIEIGMSAISPEQRSIAFVHIERRQAGSSSETDWTVVGMITSAEPGALDGGIEATIPIDSVPEPGFYEYRGYVVDVDGQSSATPLVMIEVVGVAAPPPNLDYIRLKASQARADFTGDSAVNTGDLQEFLALMDREPVRHPNAVDIQTVINAAMGIA